jgi:hypothetical protein
VGRMCPILSTGKDLPESLVRVILGPKTAVHILDTFCLMLSTCRGQFEDSLQQAAGNALAFAVQYLTRLSNVEKLFTEPLFGFV